MKFGEAFTEYLQEEQEWMLDKKFVHIEYKRLKKVLRRCRNCAGLNGSAYSELPISQPCQCRACPLCDQMFFSELIKEASDVAKYFNSRVRRLLNLHVATGIPRCIVFLRKCFKNDQQALAQEGRVLIEYIAMNAIALRKILKKYNKVHSSVYGENFKSRMHAEHIELLHSPWLIELGAFYLNSSQSDIGELNGVYGDFSCNLNMTEAAMTLVLPDSMRLVYDLTCAICLDFVFNPYALRCGHLFCKSCACSAASVMLFQSPRAANPESKCPICRKVGVYSKAVHMLELDLLLKTRCKEYWNERLADERVLMAKQTKEHWKSQSAFAI